MITAVGENPSAMLDWKCFCSDLIVDFAKWQADIIRENCPNHFITHNYMCFDDKVNYYDLGELLDLYPTISILRVTGRSSLISRTAILQPAMM